MPQKTGPAAPKSSSVPAEAEAENLEVAAAEQEPKEPAQASPKTKETPEKGAPEPEPEPEPEVKDPSQSAKEDARKLYDEGTELWFGEVDGLWFALPRVTNVSPTRQWLRAIYQLTELAQTFEWMQLAKVHPIIQDRTDLLTDAQYRAVFNAWFSDGEVSLPK